jgi:RES domain-containing protein
MGKRACARLEITPSLEEEKGTRTEEERWVMRLLQGSNAVRVGSRNWNLHHLAYLSRAIRVARLESVGE